MPREIRSRWKAGLSRQFIIQLAAGVLVGAVAAAGVRSDQVAALEEELGLRALFFLRGTRSVPDDAVLVTMTRDAAVAIALPNDPHKFHHCIDLHIGDVPRDYQSLPTLPSRWPRCVLTRLLTALTRAGADTVIFDLVFQPRPPQIGPADDKKEDEVLAKAIRLADKVILAQKLETRHLLPISQPSDQEVEAPVVLSDALAQAALGLAPMSLIDSTYRRVDGFATFKSDGWIGAGMPTVALQAYALEALPDLLRLLRDAAPEKTKDLSEEATSILQVRQLQVLCLLLRHIVAERPAIAAQLKRNLLRSEWADLTPHRRRLLMALIDAYYGDDERYFNFYGPPGSIPSIRFDELLDPSASTTRKIDLRGKVVFVGYAEQGEADQVDHYSTPLSEDSQVDTSGVELGATAFLNMLESSTLHKADWRVAAALVFVLGFSLAIATRTLPITLAVLCAVLLCSAFVSVVYWRFSHDGLWLPLVTPLVICIPLAVINASAMRFFDVRADRRRIAKAIAQLLPPELVGDFVLTPENIERANQTQHGVCVVTDAKQFTTLSESMPPDELVPFMNGYFKELFAPVQAHKGLISDTAGDSMVAVFPARSHEPDVRPKSCVACLEILESTIRFNNASTKGQLPTRIGADFGVFTLAMMGTSARREYHAVGDPVNTASRLQELNKHLGTSLLVSDRVVGNLEQFVARDVGAFLLRGKTFPVRVYELLGTEVASSESRKALCAKFSTALADLNYGNRDAAERALRAILTDYPGDGPTLFYLDRIRNGELFPNDGLRVD